MIFTWISLFRRCNSAKTAADFALWVHSRARMYTQEKTKISFTRWEWKLQSSVAQPAAVTTPSKRQGDHFQHWQGQTNYSHNTPVPWLPVQLFTEAAIHDLIAQPSSYLPCLCVWPYSSKRYVTRDPTMETEVAAESYYKWINTNASSWTLYNTANY